MKRHDYSRLLMSSANFLLIFFTSSSYFFFFSSRRRHTRFDCDWSSDVCSSDLHVISDHLEQGWELLCNGIVVFDDCGALLPDGQSVCAQTSTVRTSALAIPA